MVLVVAVVVVVVVDMPDCSIVLVVATSGEAIATAVVVVCFAAAIPSHVHMPDVGMAAKLVHDLHHLAVDGDVEARVASCRALRQRAPRNSSGQELRAEGSVAGL